MLLTDRELKALLDEMNIGTGDHQHLFKPDEQIQPCSIDLQLDRMFWLPRKRNRRGKIDFRRPSGGRLEHQRLYERRILGVGEGIILKPGGILLGRTLEKFTIPNGYSARLEGRSTFARLGLSIHSTGGFINPGWRGRMPLQLVNEGRIPVVIAPFLMICQLVVVKLSGPSERPYGTEGLGSKYQDDEGEPSRYWLDRRIRRINAACRRVNIQAKCYEEFDRTVGKKSVTVMDRFIRFLDRVPSGDLTNAREILERFAEKDTRRHTILRKAHSIGKWLCLVPVTTAIGAFLKTPYGIGNYVLWAISAVLLIPGVLLNFFVEAPTEYFSRDDLVNG